MKKMSLPLCLALLLLIGGCSDATTNVDDKDDTLISIGDESIEKGDVYTSLLATGNINPVTNEIKLMLADKAVKTTKELETTAKANLASQKESIGVDNWDDYLKNNGYKNEDDFYKKNVLPSVKANELKTTYVKELFDTLVKDLEVKKIQVIMFDDKTKLEQAQKELKKNDDFAALATQFGKTDTFNGTEIIYSNKGTIPASVYNEIVKLKKGKTSDAIPDANTGYYYIVKMVEPNASKFKEEAQAFLNNLTYTDESGLAFDDIIFKHYLDKFDFSIHDASVYAALINNSAKYAND